MTECYQCGKQVQYLFGDSRCGECTRLSVSEVQGHDAYGEDYSTEEDEK